MIIGIDVGKKGAIALLGDDFVIGVAMPVIGKEIIIPEIRDILLEWKKGIDLVVVEHQQVFPGQGVRSMFGLGYQYGAICGVVIALRLPIITVRPQAWKKEILAGTKKEKADAIRYVMRKYPNLKLVGYEKRRKKEIPDGVADAVCIAEYGKLRG